VESLWITPCPAALRDSGSDPAARELSVPWPTTSHLPSLRVNLCAACRPRTVHPPCGYRVDAAPNPQRGHTVRTGDKSAHRTGPQWKQCGRPQPSTAPGRLTHTPVCGVITRRRPGDSGRHPQNQQPLRRLRQLVIERSKNTRGGSHGVWMTKPVRLQRFRSGNRDPHDTMPLKEEA